MNYYLIFILAILIGSYLLDLYVERLNVRNLKTELPEEFKEHYDQDRYRKTQEYLIENTRFSLINSSVVTPVTIAFILLGGFKLVDRFSRSFNLDFDDAYQYATAEKYNLIIVSFDGDFDRTERGRRTPTEVLQG